MTTRFLEVGDSGPPLDRERVQQVLGAVVDGFREVNAFTGAFWGLTLAPREDGRIEVQAGFPGGQVALGHFDARALRAGSVPRVGDLVILRYRPGDAG